MGRIGYCLSEADDAVRWKDGLDIVFQRLMVLCGGLVVQMLVVNKLSLTFNNMRYGYSFVNSSSIWIRV